MPEDTECPTCGRDDFRRPEDMKNHHYRTHGESIARTEMDCEWCGETFETPDAWVEKQNQKRKYCSLDCKHEAHSEQFSGEDAPNYKDAVSEFVCAECGDVFERPDAWTRKKDRDNDFCSAECRNRYYSGENSPVWIDGTAEQGYPRMWQASADEIRRRHGYECYRCGKTQTRAVSEHGKRLAVHHIDQNRWNMSVDNLVPLCQSCHMEVHNELMAGEEPLYDYDGL